MFLFDRPDESIRMLQAWREADEVVSVRWAACVQPEPQTRQWRFVAYVAALDAEEAAAVEIAVLAGLRAA
jgi:hypothetical protein